MGRKRSGAPKSFIAALRRARAAEADAKAMEARRATTETGVVHDSAAPQGFAQDQALNELQRLGQDFDTGDPNV